MFIDPETYYEGSSLRRSETLFDEVENVLVLKRDVKLSEQGQVLISKRAPAMMLLLVLNVTNDHVQLRMPITEEEDSGEAGLAINVWLLQSEEDSGYACVAINILL